MQERTLDLLIIGGGITGAGVALQAAASGLATSLIEMQDFPEGTSSCSTKLVHGSLCYLKQFDVEVVSDTVSERAVGPLIVGIGLSLGGTTGYALNPVRDLGPRIMHSLLPIPNKGDGDWSYAWIPVVGPILGAALAVLVFSLF